MYLEIFFIIWTRINTSFRKRSNDNFLGDAIPGQARDDVKYLWPYNFTTLRLRVGARNDDFYPRPFWEDGTRPAFGGDWRTGEGLI